MTTHEDVIRCGVFSDLSKDSADRPRLKEEQEKEAKPKRAASPVLLSSDHFEFE